MLAATGSSVSQFVNRRRAARKPPPPPPPVTTMSSPGQIADLQQQFGAEMGQAASPPASVPPASVPPAPARRAPPPSGRAADG
jgi:hypothetical protein